MKDEHLSLGHAAALLLFQCLRKPCDDAVNLLKSQKTMQIVIFSSSPARNWRISGSIESVLHTIVQFLWIENCRSTSQQSECVTAMQWTVSNSIFEASFAFQNTFQWSFCDEFWERKLIRFRNEIRFFMFPPDQVRESSITSIFRIIQTTFIDRVKISPESIKEKKTALCKPSCLELCQHIPYRN